MILRFSKFSGFSDFSQIFKLFSFYDKIGFAFSVNEISEDGLLCTPTGFTFLWNIDTAVEKIHTDNI